MCRGFCRRSLFDANVYIEQTNQSPAAPVNSCQLVQIESFLYWCESLRFMQDHGERNYGMFDTVKSCQTEQWRVRQNSGVTPKQN